MVRFTGAHGAFSYAAEARFEDGVVTWEAAFSSRCVADFELFGVVDDVDLGAMTQATAEEAIAMALDRRFARH